MARVALAIVDPDNPYRYLEIRGKVVEITEDGVLQEIANFARDADQPLNIVMLYDTSLSIAKRLEFERKASIKFFEKVMRPQDRAAVFSVSTDVVLLQDFTENISALTFAIDRYKVSRKGTCLYDATYTAVEAMAKAPAGPPPPSVSCPGRCRSGVAGFTVR